MAEPQQFSPRLRKWQLFNGEKVIDNTIEKQDCGSIPEEGGYQATAATFSQHTPDSGRILHWPQVHLELPPLLRT
jgi:hypothetical protein